MTLTEGFQLLATARGGVARLRELILSLAVQGKLSSQLPSDEASDILLSRIATERSRLASAGTLGRERPLPAVSDSEKTYELPENWQWVRLGSVIELISGQHLGPSEYVEGLGSDIPYLTGPAEFGPESPEPSRSTTIRRAVAVHGDILITVKGSGVGKLNTVSQAEIAISRQLMAIRPILVNARFLMLVLKTMGLAFQQKAVGIAIPGIGREDVLRAAIGLPPIPEQARLVAKVDELMQLCDELESNGRLEAEQHARLTTTLFEALAASESAHALAENWSRVATHFDLLLDRPEAVDALEQTMVQLAVRGLLVTQNAKDEPVSDLLQRIRVAKDRSIAQGEMKRDKPLPAIADEEKPFTLPEGWEWVRFGDVVQISSGVTLGRKTPLKDPVSLPYLRVANVQRWQLVLSEVKDVIIDRTEIERFRLLRHDLLITEGGDWDKVGRTCLWRDEIDLCLHQNHIFKARGLVDEWCPEWAELYLNSSDARAYFASSAKQTTNLASINMSELKRCLFPIPPAAEQIRIVARVADLRQLCAKLRTHLADRQACHARFAAALVEQTAAAGPDTDSLALAA